MEEVSTARNETEENRVTEEKRGIRMRSNECAEMKDGLIHVNEVAKEIEGNSKQESDSHDDGVPNRVNLQYYSELLQSSSKAMALVLSRQVFEEKISELQLLVNYCTNREIINTVCSHLTSAITVVKAANIIIKLKK